MAKRRRTGSGATESPDVAATAAGRRPTIDHDSGQDDPGADVPVITHSRTMPTPQDIETREWKPDAPSHPGGLWMTFRTPCIAPVATGLDYNPPTKPKPVRRDWTQDDVRGICKVLDDVCAKAHPTDADLARVSEAIPSKGAVHILPKDKRNALRWWAHGNKLFYIAEWATEIADDPAATMVEEEIDSEVPLENTFAEDKALKAGLDLQQMSLHFAEPYKEVL
ncbi:hypothetical protein ACRE_049910 [Hapsidospora chrysogenum ATCC 11550]|uniref:Uncharacterized protein n=1 Tax=Hapsidospora chrysogenum (strain ATCC 11550 / CBS 779.69 / DSM 880 / IAM 14645 / JCM 23072 / IMI 49137) TaxID=857340 RepID=A0A086T4G3_HAPC1|nr:hypothetical protein ACRE_049910 [Hapsidospora chrysogenum ATCC 11550]